MKTRFFICLMCVLPTMAFGITSISASRIAAIMPGTRAPNMTAKINQLNAAQTTATTATVQTAPATATTATDVPTTTSDPTTTEPTGSSDCRTAYRACMDDFCLLDESEGYRCACSENINKSKDLILEIQQIQEEADKLYTEGVEREQMGARARLVFGESEAAKKSSRISGISLLNWLNSGSISDAELGTDEDIGDTLYSIAADYCSEMLASCGTRAEMEEMLYVRQVVQDCKGFDSYLKEQKINAMSNKRNAESAVRKAKLEMLDTTNKYNRGECLLAYKACIADKGGCGTNFENCMDVDLLGRRANACENVLEQCMAVRNIVEQDWIAESTYLLTEAAKYADKHMRSTCLAQIQMCLEDSCSTSTNDACLTNIDVASGICPVINECDNKIPGVKNIIKSKLGFLQTQFCENDIDKCLRTRCGKNFTAPECLGKSPREITALCPQEMFPSCKNAAQFDIIVNAVLLQMDYQMLQGCLNYFDERLGLVCGTDMACLPADDMITTMETLPADESGMVALRETVRTNARIAVDNFFTQFEDDRTVSACTNSQNNLGNNVFNTAKMIANISAENRALRALESRVAELTRKQDTETARKACLDLYKPETPGDARKNESFSYIKSVAFEPSLRNCHVCRIQRVCETGGESKAASALKSAAGGLTAGATAGTMVNAGWGTAIGAVIGGVGAGVLGAVAGGEKDFCQEITSCEDVNM